MFSIRTSPAAKNRKPSGTCLEMFPTASCFPDIRNAFIRVRICRYWPVAWGLSEYRLSSHGRGVSL